MCLKLLSDPKFFLLLLKIDEDLGEALKVRGCLRRGCCGKLHSARFPRKPRGVQSFPKGYDKRFSYCCAEEGCRSRHTAPSVRFLGPKVYLGAVVTLVTALKHGDTAARSRELRRLVGASPKTVGRWRRWWREIFPALTFWQQARGSLAVPVETGRLPASLLERFDGGAAESLTKFLAFINPVTVPGADRRSEN